jgi:hypothetical protein
MSETPSATFPHVASSIGMSVHAAPPAGFGGGHNGNIVVAPQPVQVQSTAPPITCALTPSSFVRTIDAHAALSSQPTFPYGVAIHPSVSTPGTAYPLCHLAGGDCSGVMPISPGSVGPDVARHLFLYHGISTSSASRAPVRECTWLACACTQQGVRCGSRPHGHAAHVKDLADHIIHSHLDFIYACDRCGRAEWSSPWALRRHRQQCRGRVAVRCTGCLHMFMSRRALEGHVELEGCYATTY